MKLDIKQRSISKRVKRAIDRLKWVCIISVSLAGLSVLKDYGISQIEQYQFVNAAEDHTFEADDDIYANYVESAKLQHELMKQQSRDGHQTWTMDDYKQYTQKRQLSTAYLADMQSGKQDKWYKAVPDLNFDQIPAIETTAFFKNGEYSYGGDKFKNYEKVVSSQGYMEEYYNTMSRCHSQFSNPGISLLPNGLLGFIYLVFLGYLFLGISISADIFMEAIDVITSKTEIIPVYDEKAEQEFLIEKQIWNPTMANLTLMAFGSSAPEIILSIIEALKDLDAPAGEMGPSTIVGSAAFNLLIISGVSIIAVGGEDGEVKKIDAVGVFLVTAIFSIWAYVWMYMCLEINSPDQVTVAEAFITFGFFFILCILAFGADKYNEKKKTKVDNEQTAKANKRNMTKSHLRSLSRQKGEAAILAAAQGQKHDSMSDTEMKQVQELYMEILETTDLKNQSLDTLMQLLKPDTLFERFAARKANQVGASKAEFLEIKGAKFQIENQPTTPVKQESELLSFKCLHYSVTESAGNMNIVIVKKNLNSDCTFGVRTREETAKSGKDFDPINEVITMKKRESEKQINITIHDNQEWQPDMDFYLELYDTKTQQRLFGDDTECRITILDEDFPGKLGFEITDIVASRTQDKVDIVVKRVEGTDGQISCMIRTEPLIPDKSNPQNAVEFEDYLPKHEKIEFAAGESEKVVPIYLVNESVPQIDGKDGKEGDDHQEEEESEEEHGPRFKVVLEKPEPDAVKISKKNCCTVELRSTSKNMGAAEEHAKMITYFIAQQNPGWSDQFKQAVMLCPKIDEDDLIVNEVEFFEAIMHFATIGWKILFATIPPAEMGGGWPNFFVAITFIGTITFIVSDVAGVLGCVLGLKDQVTAITLVSIGTSLPDTFASMTAAQTSQYADSAIGNITGSNSVNVFVGLGAPWILVSLYRNSKDKPYETPAGGVAFSVILFLVTSITCFMILGIRRAALGGELGGGKVTRYISCAMCFTLWIIYVVFSTLRSYTVI